MLDVEARTGQAREHLEFTIWYLIQKEYIKRSDNARMTITLTVWLLEKSMKRDQASSPQRRRSRREREAASRCYFRSSMDGLLNEV